MDCDIQTGGGVGGGVRVMVGGVRARSREKMEDPGSGGTGLLLAEWLTRGLLTSALPKRGLISSCIN